MIRAVALFLCLAGPVAAQETPFRFDLPAGCEAYVTMQAANCKVTHYFTCEADPEGHQRAVVLNEQGITHVARIDGEAQWIELFHPLAGTSERLESQPMEPASFSELLANQVDEYDFQTLSDQTGPTRYVGQDRLTGRQVVIDGVTLDETAYEITAYTPAGDEIWHIKGNEFINRDWRRFFPGTSVVTTPNGRVERNGSPVEFMFPDESGFLSTRPKHGCGLAIS